MKVATYTRRLLGAAAGLHAKSLRRIEIAADKAAECAFREAERAGDAVVLAEDAVRELREQAAAKYRDANVADARAVATSEAVEAELAMLKHLPGTTV